MAFHESPRFPEKIARGSSGGPGFKTTIIETEGGNESRVAHISTPRYRYTIGKSLISWADASTLKTFYMARRGALNGFRFKDELDYTSNADGRTAPTDADQTLGSYTSGTQTYQLVKRESDAGGNIVRTIYKPVSGTVTLAVGGVNQASGWTVDTTTGIVTITSATTTGTVTVGFEFDVPVRFGEGADELLDITLNNYDAASLRVELVELIFDTASEDDIPAGGASTTAFGSNISISKAGGLVQSLNPSTSGLEATLPAKAGIQKGGPIFYLVNLSGSDTVAIKDADDSSTVATLATDGVLLLLMASDSSSNKVWKALA